MSTEKEAEARLQELGIAITNETPPGEVMGASYAITGKHMDSGNEFAASGDSRLNALNALIVMARASA